MNLRHLLHNMLVGRDAVGAHPAIEADIDALVSDLLNYVPLSQKGTAGGVATLDGAGRVPVGQLPSPVMTYEGVWDASTNSPVLADGTGSAGQVYRVSVAGTRNLGSGAISFEVGDYVIYNGTAWEKSDTTDAVASVDGRVGIVTLADLYAALVHASRHAPGGADELTTFLRASLTPTTWANSGAPGARQLSTPFQPSVTRPVSASYSVQMEMAAATAQAGQIELRSDANNPPTTVRTVFRWQRPANIIGSGVLRQPLAHIVPAGHYVSLVPVTDGGSAAPTYSLHQHTETPL